MIDLNGISQLAAFNYVVNELTLDPSDIKDAFKKLQMDLQEIDNGYILKICDNITLYIYGTTVQWDITDDIIYKVLPKNDVILDFFGLKSDQR